AADSGFRVPVGGARAITDAVVTRLTEAGGQIRLGQRVQRILVRQGKVVAVRTEQGGGIDVTRAGLADGGPPALFRRLLEEARVSWSRRRAQRFRYGWGTFKMDWALSGPVPWSHPEARESAVVHAGDSVADLRTFTQEVRAGQLPSNPYLVIGQ